MDDKFKAGDRVEYRSDRRYKGVVMSVTRQYDGHNPLMAVQWDDQEVRTPRKYSPEDLVKLQTNGYDQQDIADIEKDLIELIEEHGPNVWIRNKHSGETCVGLRIGDGLVKVWNHKEVNWPVRLCEVVSQEAARMMGLRDLNTIGKGMWPEAIVPIQPCHMDKEKKLQFKLYDRVKMVRKEGYRYVEVEGTVIEAMFDVNEDGCERDRTRVEWDRNYGIYWYAAEQLEKVHNEKDLNLGGCEVKAISKKLVGRWTMEELNPADYKISDGEVERIAADARRQLNELAEQQMADKSKFRPEQKVFLVGRIGRVGTVVWTRQVEKEDKSGYRERVGVDWTDNGKTTNSYWADDLRHEPIKMSDIVSAQPMTAPTGHVFKMDFNLSDKAVEGRTAKDKGYKDGTTIPKSKRPPTYRRTLPGDGGTRGEY